MSYETAFDRNVGFLSPNEQAGLRTRRVAVAGLGGAGGAQVHVLARLGVGKFNIADLDTFELVNFNRQIGATVSTLGESKCDVARGMVLDINPTADVRSFEQGVGPDSIDAFLDGVDVVVDSLDFYCFQERFLLYRKAREKGLWVITAPPLGFGYSLLVFDPAGLRFEDYFGIHAGMSERDLTVFFISGLSPHMLMAKYMLPRSDGKLPSLGVGTFLLAGAVAAEVAALLTGRKPVPAPHAYEFDALLRRFESGRYNHGTVAQRIKRHFIRRKLNERP